MSLPEKRSLSVLVIDDHPDTLRLYGNLLGHLGHAAFGVGSIAEARALCSDPGRDFDVAIADISLDGDAGHKLLFDLARHCGTRGVLVMGFDSDRNRVATVEMGIGTFLTKPFEFVAFKAAIESVMSARSTEQ